ncbi:Dehydrogenase/reductase SDR family member 1 [Trichinella zimbabwensis]|uniref:Dehydrogenase/reductase SDR family member 1 n=1 Tax=Trichinella zimbabwensis TaxID=268475 RepID=A0A0V1HMW1_9BILA|nr:Dehydrogenase/reductase SDR family member 1 [Trichinella zimbabwensis]
MCEKGRIAFLHPDLGIGGAERLVVDAALSLKRSGYDVCLFTSHHDLQHCFPETANGTLSVVVSGDFIPRSVFGKCKALLSERSSLVKSFYRFPIDQLEDYSTNEVCRKTFKSFERHSCVHVLYPSFNTSLLSVEKLAPISETVLPRNRKYYFLSLNRFEPKKNVELAIYAFLNLRETLTEEYKDAVQLLCKRLNLNNFVSFVESPTEELKISLIVNCTALVYTPSNEHFGIVPLEAMYCQVPVIACNSGGPMETILHERTGYLVPSDPQAFADVMIKFVEDATLKTKFGQAGREWVLKKFGPDHIRWRKEKVFCVLLVLISFVRTALHCCHMIFIVMLYLIQLLVSVEMLSGRVALVTGAPRGIGRGIAFQLGEAGATVYITSRPVDKSDSSENADLPTLEKTAEEVNGRGGKAIAVYCDHSKDEEIKALFQRIEEEQNGQLDILVNNAYSGIKAIASCIGKKFWECEPDVWDDINNTGLRNHYICSVYAARLMVPRKSGLIVTISSVGGLRYLFNVPYGVGKAACDRMAVDCAEELKAENVAYISIWPGAVQTELILNNLDAMSEMAIGSFDKETVKNIFINGESTEYVGKAVVHLAADKDVIKRTGRVYFTADIGREYGFVDVNNRSINSIRSLKHMLSMSNYRKMAWAVPAWIRIPGWLMTAGEESFKHLPFRRESGNKVASLSKNSGFGSGLFCARSRTSSFGSTIVAFDSDGEEKVFCVLFVLISFVRTALHCFHMIFIVMLHLIQLFVAVEMLSGRVPLVTGASRGIGRGIALQLGEAGATVYITSNEV